MKPSDNLHQLIKSLTSNEKRYFKVFAKRHVAGRQSKYEQLFDIYDSLDDDQYDEDILRQKLKKKGLGKNLADDKKNLQETIMRSMLSFHSGSSVDSQINDLLAEEDFYRQKRLNALRRKALTKAKELAEKYEKYQHLCLILDREHTADVELEPHMLREIADTAGVRKKELLARISRIEQINAIRQWLFLQVRMNMRKDNPEFYDRLTMTMHQPPMSDHTTGDTFSADLEYHRSFIFYGRLTGDIEIERRHSDLTFDLFRIHHTHMQEERRLDYYLTMYNYLTTLMHAADWHRYEEILELTLSFDTRNEDEAGEHFQNVIFYEQLLYMNTGQLDKACALATPIREGIEKYKHKINKARQITMYMNLSLAFFLRERWSDALTYINDIISDQSDARRDMKINAKLLSLICFYQLQEYEHLSYTLRNVMRSKEYEDIRSDRYRPFLSMLGKMVKEPHQAREIITQNPEAFQSAYEIKLWSDSILTGRRIELIFMDSIGRI